ncbi:hypothetical protein AURDEDRAFT_161661 [Auricularia subglabra TFB-10046 SS5]|nr:hypothetical protein AURDEDRAFT_161661 [Auricularia subglabra TFB-10046 SS5]
MQHNVDHTANPHCLGHAPDDSGSLHAFAATATNAIEDMECMIRDQKEGLLRLTLENERLEGELAALKRVIDSVGHCHKCLQPLTRPWTMAECGAQYFVQARPV